MAITKVSSGVISANAVTATIVAENVITSSEIATDGVGTLQIADDAVTSAKLDTNIDIAGTLDVTGVLTADSNVVIAGNLTVNGSTVTNSSTNTTIEDALIELGTGTTGTPANDAGIIIERGDSNNAFMGFDESADKFIVATTTATGSSTGDLTLTAAPLVTGALTASGLSYPTSDGSANQVIKTDGSGNLSFVTAITDGAVVHNYTATGDGSTVTFDTGINPQDEVNTWVHIDGVYQNKSEYSYNGSSITFTSAPDSGAAIDIITGNQNGFSTADSVLGVYSATTTDTDTYDTGLSATNENNVNIFIEGVYQPKSTYTWSGSTITFDANTPTGLALEVIASKTLTSGAVVTASITDDAVTTAKIADNAITSAKIVNNSITGADISATTNIVANTFTGALTGNVTGNVTGNLTGTIQTAAQTNITSVGTLTGFTSTGIDDNATSTAITIDSSENSTFSGNINLDLATPIVIFKESGAAKFFIGESSAVGGGSGFYDMYAVAGLGQRFFTGAAEAMRIDDSQNLLVGTTALTPGNGNTDTGLLLKNDGRFFASSASNSQFNRNSDGDIVTFRKSGNSVGSIGSTGGDLNIFSSTSGHTGLRFAGNTILPTDNAGNASDNTVDLGNVTGTNYRFKDLYLSGKAKTAGADLTGQVQHFAGNVSTYFRADNGRYGQIFMDNDAFNIKGWTGSSEPIKINAAASGGPILLQSASTTKVRIDGDGLKFNSDTAAANALDDYEEGTWTGTVSSSTATTVTWGVGNYTKIGNMVYASFRVAVSDQTIGNNYIILYGPFAQHTGATDWMGFCNNYDSGNRESGIIINNSSGNTNEWFVGWQSTSASSKNIRGLIIYQTS